MRRGPLPPQPVRPGPPEPRRYVVVGSRCVAGASPGEAVTLALTPDAERALIAAGHVRPDPPPAGEQAPAKPRQRAGLSRDRTSADKER